MNTDALFASLTALYYTSPLATGVLGGLASRLLLSEGLARRSMLAGLGIGLTGTLIGIASHQLYTCYWDNHAGWWDTRGWTREAMIALPIVIAGMTPVATFLVCWHWRR